MAHGPLAKGNQGLYWDWNATTPPHPQVVEAFRHACSEAWANASSPHQAGRATSRVVERVRAQLGEHFGGSPRDVVFCGSGTEANNLALRRASAIVTSRMEHPSVVRCAEDAASRGTPVAWLEPSSTGLLTAAALTTALASLPRAALEAAVVAIGAANHETGVLQPVQGLVEVARSAGVRVHVDAAQAFGKVAASQYLAGDSHTVVAHKICGLQGVAALVFRPSNQPKPILFGGSQERGFRPGTVAGPLIAAFGAAIERIDPARYAAQALEGRDWIEDSLAAFGEINGLGAPRLPHVTNVSVRGWTGERLVAALDIRGVYVSSGSACSAGTTEPSAAVAAMAGQARARSAIRISLGPAPTSEEVSRGVAVFFQVLRQRSVSD